MKFLICLLLLSVGLANADTLYVTEFQGAPPLSVYYQAARGPAVADQTPITVTGTSAQSAAFNANTGLIRVQADATCHVVIGGTSPVATATNMRMVAGQTEYFLVTPGQKLAVITGP